MWWLERVLRRLLHPRIICELADDYEDGAFELHEVESNFGSHDRWEGTWRGLSVVIGSDADKKMYRIALIGDADYGEICSEYLVGHILRINRKRAEELQDEARRKVEQRIPSRPHHWWQSRPRKNQLLHSDLAQLESLLIREMKHLTKEISIAIKNLRDLRRIGNQAADYYRRLQLAENRLTDLRESKQVIFAKLEEVTQLKREQHLLLMNSGDVLPLPEEVFIAGLKERTDGLIQQVDSELRASKRTLVDTIGAPEA